MDEQQLQQKERELKVLESNLEVREADLNLRETRAQMGIENTINRQEFLRRAIEVGSTAYQKLDCLKIEGGARGMLDYKVFEHLGKLIDTAAIKLNEELSK